MFDSNLFFSDSLSFTNKVRALTFRYRSNPWEVFLEKGVPKIYSKSTGEHPCQSAISIKLLCNFIKITLRNGCSPVNLMHILRITFRKNCSRGMLLQRFWCNDFLRSQDFWRPLLNVLCTFKLRPVSTGLLRLSMNYEFFRILYEFFRSKFSGYRVIYNFVRASLSQIVIFLFFIGWKTGFLELPCVKKLGGTLTIK